LGENFPTKNVATKNVATKNVATKNVATKNPPAKNSLGTDKTVMKCFFKAVILCNIQHATSVKWKIRKISNTLQPFIELVGTITMPVALHLKRAWEIIQTSFINYAGQSTVHGVNYIAEKGRSWCERIWWITVLVISMFCCGKLIFDAWNINPIIITFQAKPTPIWQIPFPAVTICPRSIARWNLTKIFQPGENGGLNFENLSETE
jgi:Amiloride-sensitive sodium channel